MRSNREIPLEIKLAQSFESLKRWIEFSLDYNTNSILAAVHAPGLTSQQRYELIAGLPKDLQLACVVDLVMFSNLPIEDIREITGFVSRIL